MILVVLTNALWRRGDAGSLRVRLRALPRRLAGRASWVTVAATMMLVAVGGYIFYNTNVLNEYRTQIDDEERAAELEKALLGFEAAPQPRIVDVELNVEIFPRQLRVATTGRYTIENREPAALREIHVRWARDTDLQRLDLPGARLRQEFEGFNYRIYDLEPPLEAGARAEMRFATVREQRGFRNARNQVDIVGNGTFLNNMLIAPFLGMGREELLLDRAKRRKYGLPPEHRLPKLEDEAARATHYLRRDTDWTTADITVSTDADQQAIAPGEQVSETVADGRRVVRYRTSAPIMHFFSIQSAAYAVKRDSWNDVDLAVYYHPSHAYNVDRMIAGMKHSLDYFTANFSPFQFKQLRILEFPAYRTFAQSFATTIPYSESIGFIASSDDPEKIDLVTYVTAHEVGHQWWGHQVMGGELQGMTVLVETLAQYSALMVMEHLYGPDQIRKFLRFELDRYLRSRGGELIEELPLERVENQPYIHYQKGSLVMYLLKDIVGEDAVNRALRGLIGEFAFKAAPYPTSRDLLRYLRAEAGTEHQQLITDLFENITLYDVKLTGARKQPRADGTWDVALEIDARKLYADGEGRENEAALDEPFDVGIFTAEPGKKDFNQAAVLHLRAQADSLGPADAQPGHRARTVVRGCRSVQQTRRSQFGGQRARDRSGSLIHFRTLWCRYRLEHVAPAWPALPVSRMTGDPRRLRPEEREPIDSGGKNGLVASVRQGHERHVVDRVPGPVRARDAGVDVAAGADTDAKAAVRREVLPLEGPENRVADIGRGFRNLRSSGLLQSGARRDDQVDRSQVPPMQVDDGLARPLEHRRRRR